MRTIAVSILVLGISGCATQTRDEYIASRIEQAYADGLKAGLVQAPQPVPAPPMAPVSCVEDNQKAADDSMGSFLNGYEWARVEFSAACQAESPADPKVVGP